MSTKAEKIQQFCSITGAKASEAKQLLEACNDNLDLAIDMHMDSGGNDGTLDGGGLSSSSSAAGTSAATGSEDEVRAPIPQKNETLIEDVPAFVIRGRRRQAKSVFDGFRDFQAEARQQEEMLRSGANQNHKKRTLEDLFRPPIDITYKGTFAHAREAGTNQQRYIMVNIQNVREFVCQALNRDVWSNPSVKALIKDHFIFWQVYHDSEEGTKYTQFYKIDSWPYVAIIDPRTGENLVTWQKLDAITFCDLVTEFMSSHPFSDSLCESPPSKRMKRESSIVDLSEDDQMQAAIQASLDQEKQSQNASIVIESDSDSDELETFSDTEDESSSPKKNDKKSKEISKNDCFEKASCSKYSQNSDESESREVKGTDIDVENINNVSNGYSDTNSNCDKLKDSGGYLKHVGSEEDPKSKLLIRFPDGNRQQLCISCKSKLLALVLYVCEQGYSNERYELVTNFPKRKLSYMDFDITLEEAGLFPQESIFVQSR